MSPAMKAETLRERNTSLVLRTILNSQSPVSRAQVATQTGLTRATVSRLVDDLRSKAVIEELEPAAGATGRPSLPLQACALHHIAISLEVNINYLSAVVMDLAGNSLFSALERGSYRGSDPAVVLSQLGALLAGWAPPRGGKIISLGLCIPGLVDPENLEILTAPNLGWRNIAPFDHLAGLPKASRYVLMNEADAAAYATLYQRPGKLNDVASFMYLSGEVGIGSSIMFNGKHFTGTHNWAGEIGHMCVDPRGPECSCGSNGCLEQFIGQDALLNRAKINDAGSLTKLIRRFEAGDPHAREAIDEASIALGRALANVANLLDIDVIVLGGNLGVLLPHMQEILLAELHYRTLASRWTSIQLVPDDRGNFAATYGMCLFLFEKFLEQPHVWLD